MNGLYILKIVSVIALFIPVLLIFIFGLYRNKNFLALAGWFFLSGISNFLQLGIIPVSENIANIISIINNIFDGPLMLLFLLFFIINPFWKKTVLYVAAGFFVFEIILCVALGFSVTAIKIILAIDTFLVLGFVVPLFSKQVQRIISGAEKNMGPVFILASIIVSYAFFTLIYIFYYILNDTKYLEDTHILYSVVSIAISIMISVGLYFVRKLVADQIEERKSQKELASLYGDHHDKPIFEEKLPSRLF